MADTYTVKYRADEGHDLTVEHDGDAGYDLRAARDIWVPFNSTVVVGTTVELRLPDGLFAEVMSRSGLASKSGVFVLNAPGIIDTGYEDDIKVILHNLTTRDYTVKAGDRVAQIVFREHVKVNLERVEDFDAPAPDTEDATPKDAPTAGATPAQVPAKRTRGRNGLGSTGR